MDKELSFNEVLSYARDFKNFPDVFMGVSLHPDWLTKIPEGRRWAMLHHIVLSGNVDNFDQILPTQQSNPNFRLLCETTEKETVLDIARAYTHLSDMLKRIERLVALDDLLNYAKAGKWDKCFEIVKKNPEYGNQKPPYRRYYLIHQLAYSNAIDQFKRFQSIEGFRFALTLRVDQKKINEIAREGKSEAFAKFIEKEYPTHFDDDDDVLYQPTEAAKTYTQKINILMVQPVIHDEPEFSFAPVKNQFSRGEVDKMAPKKPAKAPTPAASNITTRYPKETLLKLLTCSLTNAVVQDPVVAADGFTYEREAIENWLQRNDHSPMTNEKLSHKNLSPNTLAKLILDTLNTR